MLICFKAIGNETLTTEIDGVSEPHGVYPEDPAVFRVKAFNPLAALVVRADFVPGKGGWNFGVEPDEDANAPAPDWPVQLVKSPQEGVVSVFINAPDGAQVSREA